MRASKTNRGEGNIGIGKKRIKKYLPKEEIFSRFRGLLNILGA